MNAAAAAAIAETRRRMSMRSARRSRTTSRAGKSLASDLPNRSVRAVVTFSHVCRVSIL